jgi:hypothetical protein
MMDEVNSSMIYSIYFKNFCKFQMHPHPAQQSKEKKKEGKI